MARVVVDELDMAIGKELSTGASRHMTSRRERLAAVAEALGVHRNTVIRRILRMRLRHIFFPMRPYINLHPVGGVQARAFFPVPTPERTPQLLERLGRLRGVWRVSEFVEGMEIQLLAASPERAEAVMDEGEILAGRPAQRDIRTWLDWAPVEQKRLRRDDIPLLVALVDDVRASLQPIAKRLGVSKRTLERRMQQLQEDGVLRMQPGGDGILDGMTVLYMQAWIDGSAAQRSAARKRIHDLVPNHVILDEHDGTVWYYMYGTNLNRLLDQVASLAKIPGVARTVHRVFHRAVWSPSFARDLPAELGLLAKD